ncbi:MAG: hypothetical protein KKD77_23935 [Gammaproteobacteria bacterium]|nr:hypothetical protein [Gammaproteobacteria bacterium]
MKNFETEEQAKTYLHDNMLIFMKKNCPVFKTKCQGIVCMSFSFGRIQEIGDKVSWNVYEPRCNSPLVMGYIEMDGNWPC